jgi:hypothetical protein
MLFAGRADAAADCCVNFLMRATEKCRDWYFNTIIVLTAQDDCDSFFSLLASDQLEGLTGEVSAEELRGNFFEFCKNHFKIR